MGWTQNGVPPMSVYSWYPVSVPRSAYPVTGILLYVFQKKLRFKCRMRSEATQTLRAGCSKAEPKKKFAPPQTPFPEAQDRQNLISWRRSLPLPTDPVC